MSTNSNQKTLRGVSYWLIVAAASVYAVTGQGHLESEGVDTLQKIKRGLKQRRETTVA